MPGGGGKGGGGSSTVNVNNGPITVDSDSTVDIVGLDNLSAAIDIKPIKTDSRQEFVLPQPFKSESKSESRLDSRSEVDSNSRSDLAVDLKPIALDICSTNTTRLPHGQISQPYNLHFGLTWFGLEVLGFNLGGESRTVSEDLPKKPAVDWPAQQNSAPRPTHCASDSGHAAKDHGLRIKIK